MISYPEANYIQNLSTEIAENTRDLPLYMGGPAVDYTEADHAYALNATLLYDPRQQPEEVLVNGPSEAAQILLVERASGHGKIGSFNGVSGYIDTVWRSDEDTMPFDPVAHTLREEFATECGLSDTSFDLIDFRAGKPTIEDRTFRPGAKITVVPILGLCTQRPEIYIDQIELASYQWVDLLTIGKVEDLAGGYLNVTLPATLGAIGLKGKALAKFVERS